VISDSEYLTASKSRKPVELAIEQICSGRITPPLERSIEPRIQLIPKNWLPRYTPFLSERRFFFNFAARLVSGICDRNRLINGG
jgi:hypothetical protein